MLKISEQQTIQGVTVFGDDRFDDLFYVLPEAPRFRLDERGRPIFKFLKYRTPLSRPDGRVGGGFAFFDTEFSLTSDKRASVLESLQAQVASQEGSAEFRPSTPGQATARLGQITYSGGSAKLLISKDNGALVDAVSAPGKPSLMGRNIAAFMVELTAEGATLFEQALQGQGGVVQVVYDLTFWAKLPELSATAWFNADRFYSFEQTIDIDWQMYGDDEYIETITEEFVDNETMGVDLRFDAVLQDPEADRKLKESIRTMMQRSLQDAVMRKMIPDIDAVPTDERGMPEDIEHLERTFTANKVANFENTYRENSAINWNIAPQGTIPNITTLVDFDGDPIVWSDYASLIDLNDPFFQKLTVQVGVNADFENLPIHSIEVKLEYKQGDQHKIEEFPFIKAEDKATFETFIADGVRDYTYSYQVNYEGSSKVFVSEPVVTTDTVLTVNVDDIGLLSFDFDTGDIDFAVVKSAQVTARYQDTGVDAFEEQFALTSGESSHKIRQALFQPRRRPLDFRVDYFMMDGRQIATDWETSDRSPILVNDPLGRSKKFEVRAVGDFVARIDQIFIDLTYRDDPNNYVVEKSFVLKAGSESVSQAYAVLGLGTGVVSYSGQIRYRDGTVQAIPATVADGTIVVGDVVASKLSVTVVPDLLDWTQVRLAKLALRHGPDGVGTAHDMIFSAQQPSGQTWEVLLEDGADTSYRWSVTFFMASGEQHSTDWVVSADPSIVLQAPIAPANPAVGQPVVGPPPTPITPPPPAPVPAPAPAVSCSAVAPAPTPVIPVGGSAPPPPPPAGGSAPPPPPPAGGSAPPPPPPAGGSIPPPPPPAGGSAPPPPTN